MLWQKQKGIYENICENKNGNSTIEEQYSSLKSMGWMKPEMKNNDKSKMCRNLGNMLFRSNSWFDAMECYNESLSQAENGTENISLAYANRSACFLNFGMYDKCLVDIELAKRAGYPAKSMPKLDQRKKECLEMMKKSDQVPTIEATLDYESDKRFPCMANVLQIERNDEFGRMVTAKCDIPAGKIVLIEKAFMMSYINSKQRRCSTCLKSHTNLVPCKKCTLALFCSGKCEENRFHRYECGLRMSKEDHINHIQMDVYRSILTALEIFPNVKDLIRFVEEAVHPKNVTKIPEKLSDDSSKYEAFLQLWNSGSEDRFNMLATYTVYRMLLNQPTIKKKFLSVKHQRFLMNLVGHHSCIIQCNSGALVRAADDDCFTRDTTEPQTFIANYMNHSCAPNVDVVPVDDHKFCVTIRPIKKGEQLQLSYFRNDPKRLIFDTRLRQKQLKIMCGFECECEQCCLEFPSAAEQKAMKSDQLLLYIRQQEGDLQKYDGTEIRNLMNKCVEFLNKYGRMKWAQELGEVGQKHIELLAHKYRKKIA